MIFIRKLNSILMSIGLVVLIFSFHSCDNKAAVNPSKKDLENIKEDTLVLSFNERILIQQPFLLNKIMAANIFV